MDYKIKQYIEDHFDETVQGIVSLLKIKTVKAEPLPDAPFGLGLKRGLEAALQLAEILGFRTVNLDNYVGYAEYGEGEDYIAVLGHLDVVPEGDFSKWLVPPYGGEIVDQALISRGALDNKGPIISVLYAVKAMLSSHPDFNKRIRIIFGTNEESGDEDILYYLSKEKAPKYAFTPDGCFPLVFSEKGIYTFSFRENIEGSSSVVRALEGGSKSNMVPDFCTASIHCSVKEKLEHYLKASSFLCSFKTQYKNDIIQLECTGVPAHASSPHKGVNAILCMFKLLHLVLDDDDPLKNFVQFIHNYIGESTDGVQLGIGAKNPITGDLTLNTGITGMDNKEIFVKFNLRYPNTVTETFLDTKLTALADEKGLVFYKENHQFPLYFELDHPLVTTLQQVYQDITHRNEDPMAMGGGTYAKLLPNTIAFGPNFVEYQGWPHGYNEILTFDMLKTGMLVYAHAVLALSKLL